MNTRPIFHALAFLVLLALSRVVPAQTATAPVSPPSAPPAAASPGAPDLNAPETVLIRNNVTALTRADYDLELTRLPADARGGFGTDPNRVNGLLNRLLINKTMAAQARLAGIDKLPEAQQRIAWETERLLAGLYIERIEADAVKEFNARPGIETAARERYAVEAEKYRTGELASVTHILFDLSKHSKEEALKLAQEARAKIVAGADMNELAKEISEDPSAKRNAGRIENFPRERMDPAFAQASFALAKPGDLSEPVLSRFGYHVIRLDEKRPSTQRTFAEVKELIIADMRRQYVDQRRNERMQAVRADPQIVVNEPAVEALVIRVDQEALRKMMEQAKATQPELAPAGPAKPVTR
jgi:peptidyl-prolyl cis-trans isomerase C